MVEAKEVELDELWSFVTKKSNEVWIWGAVCRKTRRLIGLIVGDRSEQTATRLWRQLTARLKAQGNETMFYADHYNVYPTIVPPEQLIQSKKETFTIEGQNSLMRHFLARLHRKTFCYSKSIEMLQYSLNLFLYRRNYKSLPL